MAAHVRSAAAARGRGVRVASVAQTRCDERPNRSYRLRDVATVSCKLTGGPVDG